MLTGKQLQSQANILKELNFRFKGYEKLVLKEIEIAKREYFARVFATHRSDIKKTWQVIRETLSRNMKKMNFLQILFMRAVK